MLQEQHLRRYKYLSLSPIGLHRSIPTQASVTQQQTTSFSYLRSDTEFSERTSQTKANTDDVDREAEQRVQPLRRPLGGPLRHLPFHRPGDLRRQQRDGRVRQRPCGLEGDPRGARLQGRPPRREEGGGQGGGGGRQRARRQRRAEQGEGGQERQVAPRGAQQRQVRAAFPAAGGRQGGGGQGRAGERRAHRHRAQGRGQEARGEGHRDLRL
ncbi:hypothetical protein CFC21_112154, partial [Triticum aestivum]|nr:hypothetical protein [Triticum aestivum]